VAIEAIQEHKAALPHAVGGAPTFVAKAIKNRRCSHSATSHGSVYEFEVKDMPVTVAVDSSGASVPNTGPAGVAKRIKEFKIPVAVA